MPPARFVVLVLLACAAAAAPAHAATVRAPVGTCARAVHVPAHDGLLTVRLAGARGDWDLTLLDGTRRLGASASFGAREVVTARVRAARERARGRPCGSPSTRCRCRPGPSSRCSCCA
jgi:hypothetical protein